MKLGIGYIDDLKECYSQQAKHFHNTRKKYRPEVDYLARQIQQFLIKKQESGVNDQANNEPYSLLDLGCGSGRLLEALKDKIPQVLNNFNYTGVDLAQGMIDLAQETYPDHSFICDDMHGYLNRVPQESLDMILALASIQHIKGVQNQQELFYLLYKSLSWGGVAVLINRSFSYRFLKNYYQNIIKASLRSLFSPDRSRNDLIIPWKDKAYQDNTLEYDRMYHIYTLHELKKLASMSGFIIKESGYILQDGSVGKKSTDRKNARNSFVVIEKSIIS